MGYYNIVSQNNYKTQKCKNFEQGKPVSHMRKLMQVGNCKYGQHCTFAHGELDLRKPEGLDTSGGNSGGVGGFSLPSQDFQGTPHQEAAEFPPNSQ